MVRLCIHRRSVVYSSWPSGYHYLSVETLGSQGHAVGDPADDGVGELSPELHGEEVLGLWICTSRSEIFECLRSIPEVTYLDLVWLVRKLASSSGFLMQLEMLPTRAPLLKGEICAALFQKLD